MKKRLLFLFAMGMGFAAQAQLAGGTIYRINGTDGGTGPSRTFASLRSAATYVNANGLTGTGQAILEFTAPYTNETVGASSITFNAITGASASLGLTIRPAAGMNVTLTTSLSAFPVIDLNDADYVTIDGRQGGVGTTKSITLENSSTSASTATSVVRLINGAQFNTLSYLNFKVAAAQNTLSGSVLLSTASATLGNTDNIITNNTFSNASTAVAGAAPVPQISSSGTAARPNHRTKITNNNFEYWGGRAAIYTTSGDAWEINNNHFYSTQTVVADATNATGAIYMASSQGGHTISGNFIGGQAANTGGSKMDLMAISVNFISVTGTSTSLKTTIQNNTIANINTSTPASGVAFFRFILTAGSQIIDLLNNTFGSTVTANSIVMNKNTTSSGSYYLIQVDNTGTAASNIKNNTLANLQFNELGAAGYNSFFGIHANLGTGVKIIDNNTITKLKTTGFIALSQLVYAAVDAEITNNKIGSQIATADIVMEGTRGATINAIYASGDFAQKITSNEIGGLTYKITVPSAAGVFAQVINAVGSAGSTLKTINNNVIGGNIANSIQSLLGGGAGQANVIMCGIQSSAANLENNTIRNITADEYGSLNGITDVSNVGGIVKNNSVTQLNFKGQTDLPFAGIYTTGNTTIEANTISGLTSSNALAVTNNRHVSGIRAANGSAVIGNIISDLQSTAAAATSVVGISSEKATNIYKNRIYDLKSTNGTATSYIAGLALSSTSSSTYQVANNIININYNGTSLVRGILLDYIGGATDPAAPVNAYYNTVLLEGTDGGSAVSSAIFRTSNSAVDLKNNLLFNNRTGSSIHSLYGATTTSPAWVSDYNFLAAAASNSNVGNWNGTAQNFAAWKAAHSGQDVNSINDLSLSPSSFFDMVQAPNSFLRVLPANRAKVAAKGTAVSVTDDVLGGARASLPTMGAFEEVVVLPVTFKDFTAKLNANKVNLNWSVSSEVEILRYEVERLTNGTDFVKVATVSAANLASYSAVDANPQLGINYYRLSAINADGTANYFHQVKEVKVASLNEGTALVYPNPLVGSTVNVSMAAYSLGTYTYKLSDITGRLLQKGSFEHKGGSNTISVNATMPKGVYVLQVSNGKEQIQAKLIKP